MGQIFLSYAHADSDFVEIVRMKLTEARYNIWIDHAGLKAGDDWRQGIEDAIKASSALILIMSPESIISPYVTFEWAFAYGVGVQIVPVLYRKCDLHPKLEAWQYLDFTHRINRPWDALVERLRFAQ
jgi:hypothetical protein